jgi:hypothetical protein
VAARRLIMVMLVLLELSSILAALVPVERNRPGDDSSSSTTTTTRAPAPVPSGELVRRTIAADDPTPERIKLGLGDQLELTVTTAKLPDQVEIPAFGQLDDVDPDFPARFDLLALEPGSFAVRLVDAGRVVARIEVSAGGQGKRGEGGKSSDSPGSSTETSTSGARSAS